MLVSKKKWQDLEKRVADIERKIQSQIPQNKMTYEPYVSVTNRENMSLLSYQQLYSSSADSNEKA